MPARMRLIRNNKVVHGDTIGGTTAISAIRAGTSSKARATPRSRELDAYTKRKMTQLWRVAVRDAIREMALAFVEGPVHAVDTGMALASLLPLARTVMRPSRKKIIGAVTEVQKVMTFRKREIRRKQYVDIDGNYDSSKHKSIAQGIRDGEGGFDVKVGTPNDPTFIFDFQIQVWQYLMHENVPGVDIGSLDAGMTAMRASIRKNYSRFLTAEAYTNIFLGKGGRF